MKSIINKLLNKPITEKPEQISYYEKYPPSSNSYRYNVL